MDVDYIQIILLGDAADLTGQGDGVGRKTEQWIDGNFDVMELAQLLSYL